MFEKRIKIIVFDLDGTLYEDTHHFDFYASKLQTKLDKENQEPFWNNYQLALNGGHVLKVGRLYDVENDLILIQEKSQVIEAYSWNGNKLTDIQTSKIYPCPVTIDQHRILSIGDLWWLPVVIARHYGLNEEASQEAFLETRRFMMGPDFKIKRVEGFQETLLGIKEKGTKLVLLTNSPKEDSEVILSRLGMNHLFNLKIFDGKKPTHTTKRFQQIRDHFQVQYNEILSIGDNWINEILPATELGCATILIDPHHISKENDADQVVHNLSALVNILI
jgi:FMN phosphatase YigB (HAD superfamily)